MSYLIANELRKRFQNLGTIVELTFVNNSKFNEKLVGEREYGLMAWIFSVNVDMLDHWRPLPKHLKFKSPIAIKKKKVGQFISWDNRMAEIKKFNDDYTMALLNGSNKEQDSFAVITDGRDLFIHNTTRDIYMVSSVTMLCFLGMMDYAKNKRYRQRHRW